MWFIMQACKWSKLINLNYKKYLYKQTNILQLMNGMNKKFVNQSKVKSKKPAFKTDSSAFLHLRSS